ncbi:MAG: DUF3127 domain-containing protein [Bacteroidales bacterium]|nr:DUF3127 domain-containing protein [Bacteroidales bacterium]
MEILGKIYQILPEQRGESQRGPWVRGGFVIETQEQYPRKVYFTLFGEERLNIVKSLSIGSDVKVTFTIESREFQGRWYTDCRANDVSVFTSTMNAQQQGYNPYNQPQAPQPQYQQVPPQQQYQPMNAQTPQMQNVQPPQPPVAPQAQQGGTIEDIPADTSDDDLPF